MALKHNVSGTWKDIVVWLNVAGTWKKVALHHKVGTVWKQITTLISAYLPTSLAAYGGAFYPNDAFAEIWLSNSGTYGTNPTGSSGTWMTGGVNTDFECRLTGTGDTLTGPALNTWHALNYNRSWSLSVTSAGSKTFTGTLEIRMAAAPNTVLASCTFYLEAIVEI